MYRCKNCGNKKYFYENNYIKTLVVLDEQTGELSCSQDSFIECVEVVCDICKSSTEDNLILDLEDKLIVLYK